MSIGAIGANIPTEIYQGKSTGISATVETESESPLRKYATGSVLDYYNELCKQYPNITFRLDDSVTAATYNSNGSCPYLGYNNSMNQVGNNFGTMNQCSINIDAAVVKHMQQDPVYESRVLGSIKDIEGRYSYYQGNAREQGAMYLCVNIEDNGGNVQKSATYSQNPFSTEKEVKELWDEESRASDARNKVENVQRELLENYMNLLSEYDQNIYEKLKNRAMEREKSVETLIENNTEIQDSDDDDMEKRIAQILYDPVSEG
jgi:hypothetical protein